jgi:hypothetical protein
MDIKTDLLFSCGIDKISEQEVVDNLRLLNYSVDNLLLNILSRDRTAGTFRVGVPGDNHTSDTVLLGLINNHGFSAVEARDFVIEFLLRNALFASLYTNFFDGKYFYGVGSESLGKHLDRLMAELIAGGMYSIIFILFYLK